ncbi:putative specificity protein s [Phascolarctobacterium sp. CAG:266]|nr:putative specificity protein s [Phascolarctobacterium sp. CAG:266]
MKWEKVKLKEIALAIQTGPFGSQLHQSDYSKNGIPVVMPKDLLNGKISEQSIARVSKIHVNRLKRHIISNGDILYSRRGDVGRCAYATEYETGWLCGTGCLRVTINTIKANSKFIFYQLQQPSIVGWVQKHAVGSTMLNLNTAILSEIPLLLPTLCIQTKIADILSAYDELIENNQKQIKLLEEAAQRLYKEWFVDLRFPGYEKTTIIDGVPEGWSFQKIGKVFEIKYGKTLSMNNILNKGKYPVYGANGVIGYYNQKNCDDYVVLVTSRGNGSGEVLRTHDKESFITNNSFIIKPIKNFIKVPFIYQMLKTVDFKRICTGSAQPQLTNVSINLIDILVPSDEIIKRFCQDSQFYYNKIENLLKQNKNLTEARERLLPKLMDDELEV